MTGRYYYLLTLLPALPELGRFVEVDNVFEQIRLEGDSNVCLLADLLEAEEKIVQVASERFVEQNPGFKGQFPDSIPDSFVELVNESEILKEADWLDAVYPQWFALLDQFSAATGSRLVSKWARRECTLRVQLQIHRMKNENISVDTDAITPEFIRQEGFVEDFSDVIQTYYSIDNPMTAEKYLDQFRVDFLRQSAQQYSFSIDELVAYMLELRTHKRYSIMSPEKGRKILKEVTTL